MLEKKYILIVAAISGSLIFISICGCGGVFVLLKRREAVASNTLYDEPTREQIAISHILDMDQQLATENVKGETAGEVATNIRNYVSKAQALNLQECPPDFRLTYRRHLYAWSAGADAVDELPDGFLDAVVLGAVNAWTRNELDGGQSRLEGKLATADSEIRTSWFAVEDIALKYGVAK